MKKQNNKPYEEYESMEDYNKAFINLLNKRQEDFLEELKKANDLSDYYRYIENQWTVETEKNKTKKPIYRGCPNRECLCTGKCKEIIGYE